MTIIIAFHQSGYRTFKHFYEKHVCVYWCEVWLRKRVIIESVIKELKTQTQLEHSRHRSIVNFQVNAVTALIAYQLLEHKPSVNLRKLQEINDGPMLFNF